MTRRELIVQLLGFDLGKPGEWDKDVIADDGTTLPCPDVVGVTVNEDNVVLQLQTFAPEGRP